MNSSLFFRNAVLAGLFFALVGVLPQSASAHQQERFQIGDKQYQFVVGFLNEPAVVDDKTGVDLTVTSGVTPVTGLESTLKVEISAGDKKQTFDLDPVWGAQGKYKAVFYPTVETTYTFRFFGTVNTIPFDASFSCNQADESKASEDTTEVEMGDSVKRVFKTGAYGCPLPKPALGFPEKSSSLADISASLADARSLKSVAYSALALAVVALGLALRGWKKRL